MNELTPHFNAVYGEVDVVGMVVKVCVAQQYW